MHWNTQWQKVSDVFNDTLVSFLGKRSQSCTSVCGAIVFVLSVTNRHCQIFKDWWSMSVRFTLSRRLVRLFNRKIVERVTLLALGSICIQPTMVQFRFNKLSRLFITIKALSKSSPHRFRRAAHRWTTWINNQCNINKMSSATFQLRSNLCLLRFHQDRKEFYILKPTSSTLKVYKTIHLMLVNGPRR